MCGVCDSKVSKAQGIPYRVRISGRVVLVHPDCEWQAINDTRVIKGGE